MNQPEVESGSTSTLAGIVYMGLGVSCFAVIDAIAKVLSDTMGPFQITWARHAFFLLPLLLMTPLQLWSQTVKGDRVGLNLLRSSVPPLAALTAVMAVAVMPLDLFTAITFATPLIVTALSGPVLGERPGLHRWAAVMIGFGGILIIARPWNSDFGAGVALALLLAFLFAGYQLLTRMLAQGGDPRTMLLQLAVVGFVAYSLVVPFDWVWPDRAGWVLMVASGLVYGASHMCFIRAFALAPASTLAPFIYVQIISAVALGYVLFGDVPDASTLFGCAIVVACGVYIGLRERRLSTSG